MASKTLFDVFRPEFENTGIPCLLSLNPQPAFCVDLDERRDTSFANIRIVHGNSAFHKSDQLKEKVYGTTNHDEEYNEFWTWLHKQDLALRRSVSPCSFAGYTWTQTTVNYRWRVACIEKEDHHATDNSTASAPGMHNQQEISSNVPRSPNLENDKRRNPDFGITDGNQIEFDWLTRFVFCSHLHYEWY